MKSPIARLFVILIWLGVVFVLSTIPRRYDFLPVWFVHAIYPWPPFYIMFSWDDLVSALAHISMYAILAYLTAWLFIARKKLSAGPLLAAFALTVGVGFVAEVFQDFIPQRGFGTNDLLFNGIGALLGLLVLIMQVRKPVKSQ